MSLDFLRFQFKFIRILVYLSKTCTHLTFGSYLDFKVILLVVSCAVSVFCIVWYIVMFHGSICFSML